MCHNCTMRGFTPRALTPHCCDCVITMLCKDVPLGQEPLLSSAVAMSVITVSWRDVLFFWNEMQWLVRWFLFVRFHHAIKFMSVFSLSYRKVCARLEESVLQMDLSTPTMLRKPVAHWYLLLPGLWSEVEAETVFLTAAFSLQAKHNCVVIKQE